MSLSPSMSSCTTDNGRSVSVIGLRTSRTSESKAKLLMLRPPDHCLMGKATAHQMRVLGSRVHRIADLSRVLAIFVLIDGDEDFRLSSTYINSKLCWKCGGA